MRWPDIFYKAKKRRQEAAPAFRSSISATPKTTAVDAPAAAATSATATAEEMPQSKAGRVESKSAQPSLDQPILPGNFPLSSPTKPVETAKTTDLDPIVPAAKSKESVPPSEPPSAVSPPAFTLAVPLGSVTQAESSPKSPSDKTSGPAEAKAVEPSRKEEVPVKGSPESKSAAESHPCPLPEKKSDDPVSGKPTKISSTPTVEVAAPAQSKADPTPASIPLEHLPVKSQERKEFLLLNGERIFGNVLSETPENIYVEHGTLGVLTLPRSQIATRPVEIILINGDRIVGDIMAETPETLYVRHASLGMLTVPRSQRSTRVVEALLKDGDRILGEVLAETENCTVIRSSTLGTISVPHSKVAMLNRKIEQMALKALPTAAAAIQDKPSA